ncbi:hypothetical protein ISS30_00520 [bacterium]|nr:hypothetical protein [FCB group bacterium]MBL7190154.1 hypothetical protein [bacterium]
MRLFISASSTLTAHIHLIMVKTMKRIYKRLAFVIPILILFAAADESAGVSGFEFSGGESINRVALAETLGPGGFHFDLRSQFQRMELDTSNYFLRFNAAYGLYRNVDFYFSVPYYKMNRGGVNKSGQGDAAIGLKISCVKPWKLPVLAGFQASFLLPTGYQNHVNGFPEFSVSQIGFAPSLLLQLQSSKVELLGNIGAFTTENRDNLEILGGFAVRIRLLGRFLMASGEYFTKHEYLNESAVSTAYFGLESHFPYIGLGLRGGVENEAVTESSVKFTIGISITSRKAIPGVSKGILDSGRDYNNIMVFEFLDADDYNMDDGVRREFARKLGSLKDITILEPENGINPEEAVLNRQRALTETEDSEADLLVFGRYRSAQFERHHGWFLPGLIHAPKTVVKINADVWVIDTKRGEQIFSGNITGKASKLRGVAFFPMNSEDLFFLESQYKEDLRRKAKDNFIENLAEAFSEKIK